MKGDLVALVPVMIYRCRSGRWLQKVDAQSRQQRVMPFGFEKRCVEGVASHAVAPRWLMVEFR